MYKDLKFPVLIVHRDIKADTVAGDRIRGIARELEQEGFSIVSATDYTEGRLVASTHHGLACMLIAAEDASTHSHLLQNMAELIGLARVRAPDSADLCPGRAGHSGKRSGRCHGGTQSIARDSLSVRRHRAVSGATSRTGGAQVS
jgi:hypothetical protein